jgi:hypothetical protein
VNRALAFPLAAAVVALPLALAACGGDEETTTTTTTTTTEPAGTTGAGGPAAAGDGGSAYIDKATGDPLGLEPDSRRGAAPPPIEISDLADAADAAGCELRLDAPDEGNKHIPSTVTPRYRTTPPTSGPHDATPLADGAYRETPEERFPVHSLEHGRVVIQYQPDLAEEDQLALKGVFDEDPEGMVLIPNPEMPYDVAATAWTNGLGCESYSPDVLDAVRDFRDEFRGKGPEKIPL